MSEQVAVLPTLLIEVIILFMLKYTVLLVLPESLLWPAPHFSKNHTNLYLSAYSSP